MNSSMMNMKTEGSTIENPKKATLAAQKGSMYSSAIQFYKDLDKVKQYQGAHIPLQKARREVREQTSREACASTSCTP